MPAICRTAANEFTQGQRIYTGAIQILKHIEAFQPSLVMIATVSSSRFRSAASSALLESWTADAAAIRDAKVDAKCEPAFPDLLNAVQPEFRRHLEFYAQCNPHVQTLREKLGQHAKLNSPSLLASG